MHGTAPIRPAWMEQIDLANRVDLSDLARQLAELTYRLQQQEIGRHQAYAQTFAALLA
jgi:hypothetical protein